MTTRKFIIWGSSFLFFVLLISYIIKFIFNPFILSIQKHIGYSTLYYLEQMIFTPSQLSDERQKKLQAYFTQLIPATMQNRELPLRLVFRHSSLGAQAFTLIDGTIILTDKLVNSAQNDEQLAVIMLYQMGHHTYQHAFQLVKERALFKLAYSFFKEGEFPRRLDNHSIMFLYTSWLNYPFDMLMQSGRFALAQMHQRNIMATEIDVIVRLLEKGMTCSDNNPLCRAFEQGYYLVQNRQETDNLTQKVTEILLREVVNITNNN